MPEIYLNDIAHGRSGDKGDTSNVCVFARKPEYYEIIGREVTPEKLKAYFGDMVKGKITRLDSLGKSMGSAVMRMKIHVEEDEMPTGKE